jgi:phage terminase small subunit
MEGPVSHRPEKPAPPAGAAGALDVPDWFDDDAKWAWAFWSDQMKQLGVMFLIDSLALQGACAAYSRAVRAERLLNLEPLNWRANIAASRNWKQVKDFCVEFGLTLVSRNRIVTANPQLKLDLELEAALNA